MREILLVKLKKVKQSREVFKMRKSIKILLFLMASVLVLSACNKKSATDSSSSILNNSEAVSSGSESSSMENSSSSNQPSTDSSGTSTPTGNAPSGNTSPNTPAAETVVVNISEFEEYGDDTTVLSEALSTVSMKSSAAIMKGENKKFILKLKNKTYKLSSTLKFTGNNIEIDGNGASLVFTKTTVAMSIRDGVNLTVRNLTIDYDPLVFTQGVVTGISGDRVTVKIDAGYRSDASFLNNKSGNDGNIWSNIHNAQTGAVLENTPHSYAFNNAVEKGNGVIEIRRIFGEENGGRALSVGDHISLFHRGPGTITVSNCNSTSFIDVSLYASPGFALNESSGEGNMYLKNFKVVPGPKPKGATAERLRSSNGDATHFGNVKKGPTFDNCKITHCGDDCINIQGFFFHVLQVNGNKLTVSPKWETPLKVGETVEGYKDDGYVSTGTAKITAFEEKRDSAWRSKIIAAYKNYDQSLADDTLIYIITLDKNLGVQAGDHITSLDRIGSGAVVKNSYFGLNRARGIVVKGSNILIENNTFESTTHPAIVAHADILWCESGFPTNVTIRNNKINASAISSNMILDGKVDQIGAILVNVAPPNNVSGFYKCMQNKNILIENNTIKNSRVFGIAVMNCDGITIKNNIIENPFCNGTGKVGQLYGITPSSAIFVGMSKNITVTGNTVTGNKISKAVEIHSTCTGSIKESGNKKQ
ncbi:MAG: right-handed parallel beta-helix repeat-containing protein [Ruminococcaceae bacterium]|nr:right-handed parallel beta-helix repeat-containing protein [Oscillospiraceae bacterium]